MRGISWRVVSLPVLLAACGAHGHPTPARSQPAATRPANDEWARQSWGDRHDAMTFLVLPNMARLFQRFDGSPYPKMTCRTCHGADAEEVNYQMPHGLPALDPAHLSDAGEADPRRARIARFMFDEVTPQMAALISARPYNPQTKSGFSCFNCHPARGSP